MKNALPWIILFLPLISAAAITLGTIRRRDLSARISIGAIVGAFALSLLLVAITGWAPSASEQSVTWLEAGGLKVEFGVRLDTLSLMMLLVVTGVGSLIHIYSLGYMKEERGFARYFASLSLFSFSMLGIVLSNNFIQMFVFWELVGVSSYLLIGFWYDRPPAADASKKAFLTNRVGDFGFLLGIIICWSVVGTLNFGELSEAAQPAAVAGLTAMGLLIFCGAVGKSAQFPLHVWLPDAMEGPTPVSALIHAATMVAAGVYMLCRAYFLLSADALLVIAWVGGATALLAAVIAVQQNDIKRILAYSTLSQLGYMVMAVGLSGPGAAMYHLTTHAFFKALLFLGAGAVIHALHHEQNIWNMGGLESRMPRTYRTFLLGTLALCGVPPFSGFYSKDEVLAAAVHENVALFVIGTLVALLTAFYMFRLFYVAFQGPPRSPAAEHAHEAPGVMTWPLVALAVPTVIAGLWGLNDLFGGFFALEGGAAHHRGGVMERLFAPFGHSPLAATFSLLALGIGWALASLWYAKAESDPLPARLGLLGRAMRNRFYFDELYAALITSTQELLARLAAGIDRWVISGLLVKGAHGSTDLAGRALRLFQTGNLQTYAFLFVLGVAILILLAQ